MAVGGLKMEYDQHNRNLISTLTLDTGYMQRMTQQEIFHQIVTRIAERWVAENYEKVAMNIDMDVVVDGLQEQVRDIIGAALEGGTP